MIEVYVVGEVFYLCGLCFGEVYVDVGIVYLVEVGGRGFGVCGFLGCI